MNVPNASVAILQAQPAPVRLAITAYVAGVNAYLATKPPLPLELRLLGVDRVEPFKETAVVGWSIMMSFNLNGNLHQEAAVSLLISCHNLVLC